jgi:hypothetical protein
MAVGKNKNRNSDPFFMGAGKITNTLIKRWNKTRNQEALNSLFTVIILMVVGKIAHIKNPEIKAIGINNLKEL